MLLDLSMKNKWFHTMKLNPLFKTRLIPTYLNNYVGKRLVNECNHHVQKICNHANTGLIKCLCPGCDILLEGHGYCGCCASKIGYYQYEKFDKQAWKMIERLKENKAELL